MVFCSPTGLKTLSLSNKWFADGTFHTASKYFTQLYIIHGWYKHRMIPCAFVLMKKRKCSDYNQVFKAIRREARSLDLELNPQKITIDFEMAAKKSFQKHWPNATLKGCMFHFGQNLYKRLVKLGLKTAYDDPKNPINGWFRRVFMLALVPSNESNDNRILKSVLEEIRLDMPADYVSKCNQFLTYLERNYINGSTFPIAFWNHYHTIGCRTTNPIEGYNNKLKVYVGAAKPNIYKAIRVFKKEETSACLLFERANSLDPKQSKPPTRRTHDVKVDAKIKEMKEMYEEKEITLATYISRLSGYFVINKKKQFSKNDSDYTDSDSSSSDSDSDLD